jgi:hypothetical protein
MSAIAKDASVTLITGVPGNGKTLRVVWYIRDALNAGEQVFVCNLNGLSSDGAWAGWVPFDDPTRWEDLPAGSILVVDEAQKFFRAATGTVPGYIKAMETIRHLGIRLILITQHPALIHANIRALIGRHEHLVRSNGKPSAKVYIRASVIDNVRSDAALAREDSTEWSYPTDCYGAYTSAEVHTVKRTVPHKLKRALVFLGIAGSLAALAVYLVGKDLGQPDDVAPVPATAGSSVFGSSSSRTPDVVIRTAGDYADYFRPLIPAMLWTMPATVSREPVAQPEVYCISSDVSCHCLTEQGTRYELSDYTCRDIARYGPSYNPFRQPLASSQGNLDHASLQSAPDAVELPGNAAAPLPPGSVSSSSTPFGTLHGYGDIGVK